MGGSAGLLRRSNIIYWWKWKLKSDLNTGRLFLFHLALHLSLFLSHPTVSSSFQPPMSVHPTRYLSVFLDICIFCCVQTFLS